MARGVGKPRNQARDIAAFLPKSGPEDGARAQTTRSADEDAPFVVGGPVALENLPADAVGGVPGLIPEIAGAQAALSRGAVEAGECCFQAKAGAGWQPWVNRHGRACRPPRDLRQTSGIKHP